MNASPSRPWPWITGYKWRLLLAGLIGLLLISPIGQVFERGDSIIAPAIGVVVLGVIAGVVEGRVTKRLLTLYTLTWMAIGYATEGSSLFAGASLLAPILFMFLVLAVLVLIARWMMRVTHVNTEAICAAICGYLLLGILWTDFYATAIKVRSIVMPGQPPPFVSTIPSNFDAADLLYFSYMTLTTTGYGDIIPRGGEVRMLAVTEAMVGLFYNTIIIARFVGLWGVHREEPAK
ncbi:MAG: ion channel [Verrucomicrobiota bacterium]